MSTNHEALLARLKAAGVPPPLISFARSSPALLASLQQKLTDLSLDALPSRRKTVGSTEELLEDFKEEMEAVKERFEKERHLPSYKASAPPREELIAAQRHERRSHGSPTTGLQHARTYSGYAKSFSSVEDYSTLQPILLKDMLVNKTHRGHYLLGRIVAPPLLKVGVTFVVEIALADELLSIYNLALGDLSTGEELDALFPLGAVLVIKEPTYKKSAMGNSNLIRIDSPSDVFFPPAAHDLARTTTWKTTSLGRTLTGRDFKAEGNAFFARKQYRLAEKAYSEGLAASSSPSLTLLVHLNRASASLHLHHPRSAHRDALSALTILTSDDNLGTLAIKEKALFRRARAEEEMRLDSAALVSYRATLAHAPHNKEALQGEERVFRRLKESQTGSYDWTSLYEQASAASQLARLDVGNYLGPISVKTATARGGGRGVFSTKAVRAGELLLVEKAFAAEAPDPQRFILSFNLETNRMDAGGHVSTVASIMDQILDDGSLAPVVEALYGGPSFPPSKFPSSTLPDLASDSRPPVDPTRVEMICTYNCFGAHPPRESTLRAETSDTELTSSALLFISASMFNHSCDPNALWTILGDVIAVRARVDIAEGDEIFVPYADNLDDDDEGSRVLSKHFPDGGCPCLVCKANRLDGPTRIGRRRHLMTTEYPKIRADLQAASTSSTPVPHTLVRRAKQLVLDLQKTYSPSRRISMRRALAQGEHWLSEVLGAQGQHEQAIIHSLLSLQAQGCVISPSPIAESALTARVRDAPFAPASTAVNSLLVNTARSLQLGRIDAACVWLKLAMQTADILNGGGKKLFEKMFGAVMSEVGVKDLFLCMD